MELRHLLYFKMVAETLHFTKAADLLHISQPPLTRQIKELENELGVVLFNRNNKRVELTEAGNYLLKECNAVIGQLDRAKQLVKQIHESVSGEFRIGYISSTPQTSLAQVLQKLKKQYPLLRTRLYELSTARQIKALEQGKLDVGVLRAPVSSINLNIQSLWQDGFSLVCPANMPLQPKAEELYDQAFISYNSQYAPHYHEQFIVCCNRLGFEPSVTHECNNMHSILSLVENNLGIAIVPTSIQQQYPYLKLNFTKLDDVPVSTEIVLAHLRQSVHPALATFITSIKTTSSKYQDG